MSLKPSPTSRRCCEPDQQRCVRDRIERRAFSAGRALPPERAPAAPALAPRAPALAPEAPPLAPRAPAGEVQPGPGLGRAGWRARRGARASAAPRTAHVALAGAPVPQALAPG